MKNVLLHIAEQSVRKSYATVDGRRPLAKTVIDDLMKKLRTTNDGKWTYDNALVWRYADGQYWYSYMVTPQEKRT